MTLERRTPMPRGKGPKADPAKVREWQRASRKSLPASSPGGRRRQAAATKAGAQAKARDRGCVVEAMLPAIPCWGPLDPQHVIPRSTAPELAAEPANIIGCCRGHHEWLEAHPRHARRLGIHGHAGDDLAVLAERRRLARLGKVG